MALLARRLRVAELLPRWSGDVLDFVVDFTTYVFVPAYAIAAGGVLPATVALALGLYRTSPARFILPTGR